MNVKVLWHGSEGYSSSHLWPDMHSGAVDGCIGTVAKAGHERFANAVKDRLRADRPFGTIGIS